MHHKLLKVFKFHLVPSLGTATHLSVSQFYYFGSLAFKTMAFFEISSLFIIKSSVDHTHTSIMSYVWSNINISNIHPTFWLIGHKSSGNCQNFVACILHTVSMYSHIQIVHIVWLIGIKTNGNYRNFVIFTCFICSIMCYVYANTKTYVISPLVWLVGCKSRGNY